MSYIPIIIDRANLTIMDVPFPDFETLESAVCAVSSNMFECFEPTSKGVTIIRDYITDKITLADVIQLAKITAVVAP